MNKMLMRMTDHKYLVNLYTRWIISFSWAVQELWSCGHAENFINFYRSCCLSFSFWGLRGFLLRLLVMLSFRCWLDWLGASRTVAHKIYHIVRSFSLRDVFFCLGWLCIMGDDLSGSYQASQSICSCRLVSSFWIYDFCGEDCCCLDPW